MTYQEIIALGIVIITALGILQRTWHKWSQLATPGCSSCSGCFSADRSTSCPTVKMAQKLKTLSK